jgi:hypothetical protein
MQHFGGENSLKMCTGKMKGNDIKMNLWKISCGMEDGWR